MQRRIAKVSKMIDTEQLAVSEVTKLIAKTDRLKAFIKSNDKEPLFDGSIYVYDSADKKSESYGGRIPVQVKSKTVSDPDIPEASFSIKKKMFEAYIKLHLMRQEYSMI
jgi:hypothetical protein